MFDIPGLKGDYIISRVSHPCWRNHIHSPNPILKPSVTEDRWSWTDKVDHWSTLQQDGINEYFLFHLAVSRVCIHTGIYSTSVPATH